MKRKLILILLASLVVSSQPAAVFAAKTEEKVQNETEGVSDQQELPEADIFHVDFTDGTADISPLGSGEGEAVGSPEIEENEELHKKTAYFDGNSAYAYSISSDRLEKISENVTMECMVKFNSIPENGEKDIFSMQEYSGIGIGVSRGKLTFFAYVDGKFREVTAPIRADQWYHITGVVEGTQVKLYVNGVRQSSDNDAESPGITYPSSDRARSIVLGGDSDDYAAAENMAEGEISFAKIYSAPLSDEQIRLLNEAAFEGTDIEYTDIVDLGLIGSSAIAEEAGWNLNLHVSDRIMQSIERIEYDVVYDPNLLEYKEVQNLKEGTEITQTESGRIHVSASKDILTGDEFRKYSSTRLGKLDFKTKNVEDMTETTVRIENFQSYCDGQVVIDQAATAAEKNLTIYSKNSMDLNGDGVIGAGDVALADEDMKTEIAANAGIYPYKHAVILTLDGAGNVWNPDFVYYASDQWSMPEKHTDEETMSKRKNTYAMELINEEFAVSYTAQSVRPPISAQNYFSILHGVPWTDVPEEYQLDNDIAADYYFADFGLEEAKYPSVFKAATQAFPERQNAAFAEWGKIVNGIIEPDAQVDGKESEGKQSFYDAADYIKSPEYNNTAVVYMQNDQMDHTGHSLGYYTDVYWDELKQYDEQYKAVMDALAESGHADDTIIITNADHGGHRQDHGSEDEACDMDIFIGVWGQTVNSGTRLEGGANADISPIALEALRIEKPDSMTGHVFDEDMFLAQEEMSRKNRDIEKITCKAGEAKAVLSLENPKSEVRVIDAVIDLKGNKIDSVNAADGEILRKEVKDDKLYLTVSYDKQPSRLAEISYTGQVNVKPVLEEIMLGTQEGREIYPDISNTEDAAVPDASDKTALNMVIAMVEKLEAEQTATGCYTEETWAAVQTALDAAGAFVSDKNASQEDVDNAFLELITAVNLLENAVQRVGLEAAIEGAKAILADTEGLEQYTPESVEALRTALAEAERVYAEEGADQETINAAARSLMDAVTSLVVVDVDTRLDILIRKAEELLADSEQYTSASIANLQAALDAAKLVAEDRDATDEEINEAYSALAEAMTSLVRKADKYELKTALDKANAILADSGRYVEDTIAGLQAAADAAQAVYDKEDASTAEVGEAVKSLVDEILKARLLGDVDGNGAVDSADSAEVLKYAAEAQELDEVQNKAADVNQDGVADSTDAAVILEYAAEQYSTIQDEKSL